MQYVELLIQGVRRFTQSHRLTLAGKRVWLAGGLDRGRTTVATLLRAAFDPDYFEAVRESLIPWQPTQDASRFALIFQHDNQTWRIACDARSGGTVLAERQGDQFVPVAQGGFDVLDACTDRFDFPAPGDWAQLYFWTDAAAPLIAAEDDLGLNTDIDPEQLQERLMELQTERQLLDGMGNAQFQLDDLENELWSLEEEEKRIEAIFAELQNVEAEIEKTAALENLDDNLIRRAKEQSRIERQEEEQRITLEQAVDAAKEALAAAEARPMWHHDKLFLGIAGGTLAGFVVPVVLKIYPLSLVGFAGALGGIPWILLQYRKHEQHVEQLRQGLSDAESALETFSSTCERERRELDELVGSLGILDAKEIPKRVEARSGLLRKRDELRQRIADEGLSEKRETIRQQAETLRSRVERLNAQLQDAGTGQRDVTQIDAEIAQIERALAGKPSGGASAAVAATGASPAQTPEARIAAMLTSAANIARRESTDLAGVVNPILTKVVNAVFENRFRSVELAPDGTATWIPASGVEPLPERAIDRSLALVTAAAAQIVLAKACAQVRSFPLVWDEPFSDLDDALLSRLGQVSHRALGDLQLIALSGRKALGSALGPAQQLP
ncbi:MAG: hypothetical protein D6761_12090 [Candidatus Dadabacteria bacterium]|nr:MAG: hypothetical protein D6761_12090 [Candidatus Dadabacteria bacterium]